MGQFGRTLSFRGAGRFRFRLPVRTPTLVDHHEANWRGLEEQWNGAPWPYAFGWELTRTAGSADLTIGTAAPTALTFSEALWDPNGFWRNSGDTRFVKVPPGGAGVYAIFGYVLWDISGAATTGAQTFIMRQAAGGTFEGIVTHYGAYPSNIDDKTFVSTVARLNDGDTLYLGVSHLSGANRVIETFPADASTNTRSPLFKGYRIAVFG